MLNSGRQLRDYTPKMISNSWKFFDILDSCVKIQRGFEILLVQEFRIEKAISRMRMNMLESIIEVIDLAGFEFRDRRGNLVGVIEAVSEPKGAAPYSLPSDAWVHFTGGHMSLETFRDLLVIEEHYVCLPSSRKHGDDAMVEAFQAKLEE
jgi:hypothetical protein